MNILKKLNNSIAKLSNEATDLALLKDKFNRDIADIDVRLSQIVGAIKEITSIIEEARSESSER